MDIFNLAANPYEGNFKALGAQLVSAQFLALVARGEERGAEDDALDLLIQVRDAIKGSNATLDYWIPEVSTAHYALRDGASPDSVHQGRAQLIAAGFMCGLLDSFELEVIGSPASLYLGGQVVEGSSLGLKGSGDRLSVYGVQGSSTLELRRHPESIHRKLWTSVEAESLVVRLDGKPAIRLVDGGWDRKWGTEDRAEPELSVAHRDHFEDVFSFLKEHLPVYYQWVVALTSELTPLTRPGENIIGSSSSDTRFGGLNIAFPATPTETAEMFVHEGSHQYFHMLNWIGPVVTEEAGEHYSPLKKRNRPLDRILLGYHAFANASIAFDTLIEAGYGDVITGRKNCVDEYMRELIIPLESEQGLAELGLALYRPLRRRIAHLFYEKGIANVSEVDSAASMSAN